MSRSARRDTGGLSTVSFPIRFNNSNEEPSFEENPNPRAEQFISLADLRASLPASCDLVEYVRDTPQPLCYSYVPHALPPSNPALGQIPPWSQPNVSIPIPRSRQLIPAPPPHDLRTLPTLYTLTPSADAPHLRVSMQPPVSAMCPTNAVLHQPPFPSTPINSGSFTNGYIPPSPSSSEGSSPDVEMADQLHENLAELSLHPTTQSLNLELGQMRLHHPSEHPQVILPVWTDQDCPVPEPHAEGVYRFNGEMYQLRDWCANGIARRVFGVSNPPPRVWRALDALAQGVGTWEDARAVGGFQGAHFVGGRS